MPVNLLYQIVGYRHEGGGCDGEDGECDELFHSVLLFGMVWIYDSVKSSFYEGFLESYVKGLPIFT